MQLGLVTRCIDVWATALFGSLGFSHLPLLSWWPQVCVSGRLCFPLSHSSHPHTFSPCPIYCSEKTCLGRKRHWKRKHHWLLISRSLEMGGGIAGFRSCPKSSSIFIPPAYLIRVTRALLPCIVRLAQIPIVSGFSPCV